MIDYSGLPPALRAGAQLWLEYGVPPGSFLYAVIKNDLTRAFGFADNTNRALLRDIMSWWNNNAPIASWGDNTAEWADRSDSDRRQVVAGMHDA